MQNINKDKFRVLVKNSLVDYSKEWIWILAVIAGLGLLNIFFASNVNFIIIMRIPAGWDLGYVAWVTSLGMLGIIVFEIFVRGIVAGSYLPTHVRQGISRNDYYLASVLSSSIISIFVIILYLALNLFAKSFLSPQNWFYYAFDIFHMNPIVYLAGFVALYMVGYMIAMVCQKLGLVWSILLGVALFIAGIVSIVIGWIEAGLEAGFYHKFNPMAWDFPILPALAILAGIILISFAVTTALKKNHKVKLK